MKLTDKTTQEYLNYFSERGIDVYEALSKWGNAAAVAEKVTRGEMRGSEAVEKNPLLHAGAVRRPVGADGGHL